MMTILMTPISVKPRLMTLMIPNSVEPVMTILMTPISVEPRLMTQMIPNSVELTTTQMTHNSVGLMWTFVMTLAIKKLMTTQKATMAFLMILNSEKPISLIPSRTLREKTKLFLKLEVKLLKIKVDK